MLDRVDSRLDRVLDTSPGNGMHRDSLAESMRNVYRDSDLVTIVCRLTGLRLARIDASSRGENLDDVCSGLDVCAHRSSNLVGSVRRGHRVGEDAEICRADQGERADENRWTGHQPFPQSVP